MVLLVLSAIYSFLDHLCCPAKALLAHSLCINIFGKCIYLINLNLALATIMCGKDSIVCC